jgi:hypothetical protein
MCYAQIAADNASDPVYADGWQEGDNGGYGFTPWNFDSTVYWQGTLYEYQEPGFKEIDDGLQTGAPNSSPFNAIGRAWRIGTTPTSDGVARAGRGFSPLQVGQTLRVVIDNPTEQVFFKGYFVRLNGGTGGVNGNICYGDFPCTDPGLPVVGKMRFQMFEYFTYGEWSVVDAGGVGTGVFDADTASQGAAFQVTRTGADTYDVLMDSFDPNKPDFAASRTFDFTGVEVDWIEFTFFNTETDPEFDTDLFVRSIEIFAETSSGDFNGDGNFDCLDINSLVAEIAAGSNNPSFDMTGDGNVDLADRDAWLSAAGEHNLGAGRAYLLGDANLDSFVDGLDFVEWNGNKFTSLAEWCGGDFTADGFVDGLDFVEWNLNKFTGANAGGAVPEPGGLWVTMILASMGLLTVRKQLF